MTSEADTPDAPTPPGCAHHRLSNPAHPPPSTATAGFQRPESVTDLSMVDPSRRCDNIQRRCGTVTRGPHPATATRPRRACPFHDITLTVLREPHPNADQALGWSSQPAAAHRWWLPARSRRRSTATTRTSQWLSWASTGISRGGQPRWSANTTRSFPDTVFKRRQCRPSTQPRSTPDPPPVTCHHTDQLLELAEADASNTKDAVVEIFLSCEALTDRYHQQVS